MFPARLAPFAGGDGWRRAARTTAGIRGSEHIVTSATTRSKFSGVEAGQIIHHNQQNCVSKRQPTYRIIKSCVDEAVRHVIPGGHAHAQSQGSAAKGTGIYSSDYDFYIRMDNTIVTTTKKQRIAVSEQLRSCLEDHDIHYTPQLKGNCIHLHHGSAAGSSLPDIDVISQRFKGDTRKEPNNKPMAAALPMVGELVRYIKQMPHPPPSGFGYTHIVHPTGFWVEQFAVRVERELSCSKGMKKKQLTGSRGFAVLLEAGMEKIARRQSVTRQQQQALEEAGMWNDSWRQAANRVLNK